MSPKTMANAKAQLQIVIDAQNNATNELKKIQGELDSVGDNVSKNSAIFKKAMIAVTAATAAAGAAITAFGVSSFKEYSEFASIQKTLATVLKNTQSASDEQIKSLYDQATALESIGVVSDSAIISAQARLAQYDFEIATIEKLIPGMMDLAVAENGVNVSMETATNVAEGFGKAMQGQYKLLRDRGFIIEEDTERIIENGTETERAEAIVALLGNTYKDVNKEMRNTPEGAIVGLSNAYSNLKKSIGFALTENLKLIEVFNTISAKVTAFAGIDYSQNMKVAKEAMKEFFGETSVFGQFMRIVFVPIWNDLKETVTKAFADIKKAVEPIHPELAMIAKAIGGGIVAAIIVLVKAFAEAIKLFSTLIAGLVTVFSGAIQIIRNLFEALFSFILGDNENAVKSIRGVWDGFKTFLHGLAKILFGPLLTEWDRVKNSIGKGVEWVVDKFTGMQKTIEKAIDKINIFNKSDGAKGRAVGGSVTTGKPYMVGENGPEMFIPSSNGRIDKNPQSSNININFNNPVVRSDADLDALIRAVKQSIGRENELNKINAF